MKTNKLHCAAKSASAVLCVAIVFALLPAPPVAAASEGLILQGQARQLALSQSEKLKSIANKIAIKQIKYVEAVKTIAAKEKNLRSFRWSPLLSFKFPQNLDMSEEYEFQIKPMILQAEITTMQHEYEDIKFDITAKADKTYIEVYITNEKITFTQRRLDEAKENLKRNEAQVLSGKATQTDVDAMKSRLSALTDELAQLMRNNEAAKTELSSQMGLDVTRGYRFANPLKDLDIPRADLPAITEKALQNSHEVYLAKAQSATALLNLNAYESFMRGKFGGKLNIIDNYLSAAKKGKGSQIDEAAFKASYDKMLKSFDAFWEPNITILFFTFTMEWFKGELSGTRYIEDDLYALYAACFEYTDALKDQKSAEDSLVKEVAANFEALVNARNAYSGMAKLLEEARVELERTIALNRLGKAEYMEVQDKQENYQTMQMDTIEMLKSYNEIAIDYNKTTCGALTPYFNGVNISTNTGSGGDSFAEFDVIEEPYYYLTTHVADMVFEFGVTVPEDFEPEITHYELWFEGVHVGARTQVGTAMRHLTLDYGNTTMAVLRLFNGSTFVTECEINTGVLRGRLPIAGFIQEEKEAAQVLGSYKVSSGINADISTVSIKIMPKPEFGIEFYSLESLAPATLLTDELLNCAEEFIYFKALIKDIEDIQIKLFDENKTLIYTASFNAENMQVVLP